jgi:hypothetical protein
MGVNGHLATWIGSVAGGLATAAILGGVLVYAQVERNEQRHVDHEKIPMHPEARREIDKLEDNLHKIDKEVIANQAYLRAIADKLKVQPKE